MSKFFDKNIDAIDNLNSFIDENGPNINRIITSPEMFLQLQEFKDCEIFSDENIKYKKIRVIEDVYFPSFAIDFAMKTNRIKFNVPCLCGIYKDEPHP